MEKRKLSRSYAIQRRFGYFVFTLSSIVIILNVMDKVILSSDRTPNDFLYFVVMGIIAVGGYLSVLKESRTVQFLQIFVVYLVATANIVTYVNVEDISGEIIALLGMYMAVQLGFFKRFFYVKAFLSIIYVAALKYFVVTRPGFVNRPPSVAQNVDLSISYVTYMALVLAIIILFWLIIKDQVQEYIDRGKGLQDRFDKNSVFIDIGKIVWGFLHDLGDINYSLVDVKLLKSNLQKSIESSTVDKQILEKSLKSAERIEKMLMAVDYKQEGIKKIIKAKHLIENERVEVNELISNLISFLKITYKLKDIVFNINLSREKIYIKASPFEILQAIENIIRNAIEAMRECQGTSLTVTTSLDGDIARVEIDDTGGGISFVETDGPVNLNEFQIGRTTKSDNGTGWGMYTAIQNIQHNSGTINIYTKKGVGTRFEIMFETNGGSNG